MSVADDLADDVRFAADAVSEEWKTADRVLEQISRDCDDVYLGRCRELRAFQRSMQAAGTKLRALVDRIRRDGRSPLS
jgi:hypothetical protein